MQRLVIAVIVICSVTTAQGGSTCGCSAPQKQGSVINSTRIGRHIFDIQKPVVGASVPWNHEITGGPSAKELFPPAFKNIGYMGMGYNILTGNPHSIDNFDPGFVVFNVFEITYDQGKQTADGQHSVPDYSNVIDQPFCSFSSTSRTITQMHSYSSTVSEDASVESSFLLGPSFSASTAYKSAKETLSNVEKRMYSAQGKCIVYEAILDYDAAKLTQDFQDAVSKLSVSDESGFRSMINKYGTHVSYRLKMGARFGFRSDIYNSKVMEMSSESINVKAAAGYSASFSVSASSTTESETKEAKEFQENREDVKKFFVGGEPLEDVTLWAQAAAKNPSPIKYNLISIESLLTKAHFPQDASIDQKREKLKEVTLAYCREISDDPDTCDETPSPPLYLSVKVKAVQSDSSENLFWKPVLEPYEKLVGIYFGYYDAVPGGMIVADTHDQPDPSIACAASSWEYKDNEYRDIYYPHCPSGFYSVSDFLTNGGEPSSDSTLPCFAEKCLIDCELVPCIQSDHGHSRDHCYLRGYPPLGGSYTSDNRWSFFHHVMPGEALPPAKCFTYSCLEF